MSTLSTRKEWVGDLNAPNRYDIFAGGSAAIAGFFGVGAIASAQELRDPMQPPPLALRKFREAKLTSQSQSRP